MRRAVALAFVAACFVLSGFAALLYQTAWTREFAFVFGTSSSRWRQCWPRTWAGSRPARRWRAASHRGPPDRCSCTALLELASRPLRFGGAARVPGAHRARGGALRRRARAAGRGAVRAPRLLPGRVVRDPARPHGVHGRDAAAAGAPRGAPRARTSARASRGCTPPTRRAQCRHAVGGVLAAARARPARTVRVGVAANAAGVRARVACRRGARGPRPRSSRGAAPTRRARRRRRRARTGSCRSCWSPVPPRSPTRCSGRGCSATCSVDSVHAFATMLASFLVGIAAGSALASRMAATADRAPRAFALAQIAIAARVARGLPRAGLAAGLEPPCSA